jgi:hypothetical protein
MGLARPRCSARATDSIDRRTDSDHFAKKDDSRHTSHALVLGIYSAKSPQPESSRDLETSLSARYPVNTVDRHLDPVLDADAALLGPCRRPNLFADLLQCTLLPPHSATRHNNCGPSARPGNMAGIVGCQRNRGARSTFEFFPTPASQLLTPLASMAERSGRCHHGEPAMAAMKSVGLTTSTCGNRVRNSCPTAVEVSINSSRSLSSVTT